MIDLDANDDEKERGDPAWCECGRPKGTQRRACKRCEFLDGRAKSPLRSSIIATLRTLRSAALTEIAVEVFGNAETDATRASLRVLRAMIAEGRVSSFVEERSHDSPQAFGSGYGGEFRHMYRLTVPARGAIAGML